MAHRKPLEKAPPGLPKHAKATSQSTHSFIGPSQQHLESPKTTSLFWGVLLDHRSVHGLPCSPQLTSGMGSWRWSKLRGKFHLQWSQRALQPWSKCPVATPLYPPPARLSAGWTAGPYSPKGLGRCLAPHPVTGVPWTSENRTAHSRAPQTVHQSGRAAIRASL